LSVLKDFNQYLTEKFVTDGFDMDKRWDICQSCPELTSLDRCKQCGCFMRLKVRVKPARCPLNKW
jgi:hypothetical protein